MASIALSKAETNLNRFAVLATYRHLLRATRIAFDGDQQMLLSARTFARKEFRANRKLDSGSLEAATAVEHAQGVAQILRENVVQGKNLGGEHYKLNIHEHTQRMENETASKLKGTTKSFQDIKSATF